MNVDEADFRRRYAELSDEGLLSINREELVDAARRCYDEELVRRGLPEYQVSEEPAYVQDEFVVGATFLFPDEAGVARALVRSFDILCYLENEHTLNAVWTWSCTLGWLRLMVPVSRWEEVQEILRWAPPNEEIATQAGMEPPLGSTEQPLEIGRGRRGGHARTALAIALFCSPAVEYLRVFVAYST